MAQVLGYITIGYVDALGVVASSSIPVSVDDTKTLTVIISEVLDFATKEAALSECAVTEVKYTAIVDQTIRTTPVSDSDANEGLLLNFLVEGSKFPQEIWVPGEIDAIIVNKKVDMSNAALLAFLSDLEGLTAVTGSNKFGMFVTGIKDAAESQRKLRRQASRITKNRP